MSDFPGLSIFGWLIFAWGVALMAIALRRGDKKDRIRSPVRRFAGVLSGAVFCLIAAILIWPGSTTLRNVLFGAAVVAGLLSWYLGRRSR